MAKKIAETPLMKQYLEMKKKHPDAVLLFRVGDFYETFSDDAITASSILGITLTRRANGSASHVELAGFPHHALNTYLPKLIQAGKRVAICEQLEDPKLTRKLVKRGITELVTPGVNINDDILSSKENNFLGGIYYSRQTIGIAFLDISTGEFSCSSGDRTYIDRLLAIYAPKEIIAMRGTKKRIQDEFKIRESIFELDDWIYTEQAANDRLTRLFNTTTLKGFGVDRLPDAVIAAGSLIHYLDITEHKHISHITSLSRIDENSCVRLDRFTVRNLELVRPMGEEGKSLLDILDHTSCPMGARMLHSWILSPLVDPVKINRRLEIVECFVNDEALREKCMETIKSIGDSKRIAAKAGTLRVSPRELVQLKNSLLAMNSLKNIFSGSTIQELKEMGGWIDPLPHLAEKLTATICDDAPSQAGKGPMIKPGVNAELDELRNLVHGGKEALGSILRRETEATGISSLKIGFNNVFGYYLEVRNTYKDKVPPEWIRKQTLVNAERYVTQELKDYEQKIIGAEERIAALESGIFTNLVESMLPYLPAISRNSVCVAEADSLLSLAEAAVMYGYTRPQVDDSMTLDITEGRHPVIERELPPGEPYISNSLHLDPESSQIMMITGPNMSGKSALLRQTALIAIMAQTGSFVPAQEARIGVIDKIFTRVGASDNISRGESTFMVEMIEAASILNNMSPRSLIIFDELGRGTSTYDGISIAWSIVENIHENAVARPKTLFATHYHELNEMEKHFQRIVNFNVAVQEIGGKVVFLRKLRPGGSEHSFGIHVAKIAGVPQSIVKRAAQVLRDLENGQREGENKMDAPTVNKAEVESIATRRDGYQLSIFQLDDPLLSQIREQILALDIDNLTPMQALTQLHELKGLLTGKDS